MPDLKFSEMPAAPNFNSADLIPGLQGGANVTFSGVIVETFITRVGGPIALALAAKAPLASPALTGTPSAPTASPGTATTQLATTAFVGAAVAAGTAGVASFAGRTGTVNPQTGDYNSSMVGLGNVDNTSDLDKPVSTAQAAINAAKAPLASPAFTGTPTAPTAAPGANTTQLATTAFVAAAVSAGTAGVASFAGRTGTVNPQTGDYDKTMVGLANVDNTSDANKPVSTAQQTALNAKANIAQATGYSTTHILTAADDGNILVFSGATNVNLTIPTGLRLGFSCQVWRAGTGTVTLNPSGTTLLQRGGFLSLAGQYSGLVLSCVGSNQFIAQGDMA